MYFRCIQNNPTIKIPDRWMSMYIKRPNTRLAWYLDWLFVSLIRMVWKSSGIQNQKNMFGFGMVQWLFTILFPVRLSVGWNTLNRFIHERKCFFCIKWSRTRPEIWRFKNRTQIQWTSEYRTTVGFRIWSYTSPGHSISGPFKIQTHSPDFKWSGLA
jgi:hypothetical protein